MEKKSVKIVLILLSIGITLLVYKNLQTIVDGFVFDLLKLDRTSQLTEALRFFLFEVPKVFILLTLIVFVVGIIRSYFSAESTRKALEGKRTFTGNVMASALGIITPFCSCSAIPLFLGFVESGIPLGITFSFLIAAPMINEVAVILLFSMFGWKVAVVYVLTGLVIAITAGWIIGKLKLEKWVQEWVYSVKVGNVEFTEESIDFSRRISMGIGAVKEIVGKIWMYVVLGIGVGAFAHGYIPQDMMVALMGKSAWYSVPLSVLIGVPLYSGASAMIPIMSVLIEKGAALGTALAFMMAVVGLSLPEMIILKKVLKLPLILTFTGIVAVGIMLVGFLFNLIF